MVDPSPPRAGTVQQQKRARVQRVTDAALACMLQVALLVATVPMVLGWGGWTYAAAVTQSMIAVFLTAPIALLARRSWWAYLVPLLSALATGALVVVGEQLGHAGA